MLHAIYNLRLTLTFSNFKKLPYFLERDYSAFINLNIYQSKEEIFRLIAKLLNINTAAKKMETVTENM